MASYSLKYTSTCSGGGHFAFDIYRNGVKVGQRNFTREDIFDSQFDWEDVMRAFIREAVKSAGATTLTQAKTAIEAKQWVL